jgi:hypothetical protein
VQDFRLIPVVFSLGGKLYNCIIAELPLFLDLWDRNKFSKEYSYARAPSLFDVSSNKCCFMIEKIIFCVQKFLV